MSLCREGSSLNPFKISQKHIIIYIMQVIMTYVIVMQVTYQTDTFLDKNRDYVIMEHCNLLSSSKCPFVSGLFASLPEEPSRSSYKFSSVSSRFKVHYISITMFVHVLFVALFIEKVGSWLKIYKYFLLKQQLQALMETLNSTEPHYVRCVKPNSLNRPQIFENQSVLHQLRCGVSGI